MSERFELIKQAYEKITSAAKFDKKEFCRAVKPVAEAYGAALITAEMPVRRPELPGRKNEVTTLVIYGDENYKSFDNIGTQQVRYEGENVGGGKTLVTWVCSEDRVWSDSEISDINFICRATCTVSEKIRLAEMANKYFYFDTATGLHNLNGLFRFTASLMRRKVQDEYIAAFINIVGFNYINKKAGYKTGTRLIKQYSVKMRSILEKDEIIARLGGDNFVLVFKKQNREKVLTAFEGIRVKCRVNSGELSFVLAARAGVYEIESSEIPFDVILNYISAALNYAKSYTRNALVYYSKDIERKVMEYKEYVQRFQAAVENDEFFVVYQPKVYTENDTLYGGEALVRWNFDGKVIYPGEFVEVLEKEHLVSALDFYVLEHTCRDLRRWIDKGIKPVKISINFSNDHLLDDTLVEDITAIVDRYGIDHSLIEIEMTETADVNEITRLLAYVDGLHKNGFTVAIDDFGVGYSSLQVLQSVNVDVLKIDKSFVDDVSEDKTKRENIILKHIINMAGELGVEIVAEGVETGDQRSNLREMNCHRIQGYVYDKPLESDEFEKRMFDKNYENVSCK